MEYFHYAALGSVRLVVDFPVNSSNYTITRHDYLPFGEEIPAGTFGRTADLGYGDDPTPRRLTGKERDPESGLDYFGARYYSGAQGRFTTTDPLMASERPQNPQSWNRYSYGGNNPLRFVDATGLDYYDANGSRIGGTDDNNNYIVTDRDQIKQIQKSKTNVAVGCWREPGCRGCSCGGLC